MELAARAELARILSVTDPESATSHLARCDEILDGGEDWRGRVGRVHLARAHVLAGDGADAAAEALDAAHQVFTSLGLAWHEAETELARATLLGETADAAAAAYRDARRRRTDGSTGPSRPSRALPHPSHVVP